MSLFGILLSQGQRITLPSGRTVYVSDKVWIEVGVGYVGVILRSIFILGVVLCLITLTWSGVQWASAKGDTEKRARARIRLTWSFIGFVVFFMAYSYLYKFVNS
jgi:Type IV secretion system pilin